MGLSSSLSLFTRLARISSFASLALGGCSERSAPPVREKGPTSGANSSVSEPVIASGRGAIGSAGAGEQGDAGSGSAGTFVAGSRAAGGAGAAAATIAGSGTAGTGGRALGGGGGARAATSNGCIVPLYSYPSDAAWNAIVQAKRAHPAVDVIAIVNPASGPGSRVDAMYTAGIAKLVAAGIVAIGYVSTSYTKRGQAEVNADSDRWRASYPAVQGIFFDEQSAKPGDEAFYSAVSSHAKAKGFSLVVGNPGTHVPNSFLGTVDVMLSYESGGTPTLASLDKYAAHREQFGIIPYAAAFDAAYVSAAARSVRYVYVTNDDLPNPWDSLPSYFDALLGALASP